MARIFRLALAQLNLTVGDLPGNADRMAQSLRQARNAGADLVAFPELATTGYPPEDLLFKQSFLDANVAVMQQLIAEARGLAVVLGYVRPVAAPPPAGDAPPGPALANSAAVGYDGRLVDVYDKIFLPNYGVFDEERYFVKGGVCPVYEIGGARIGVNVCEDIWYEIGPASSQRWQGGAELIVNINASPFHAGKSDYRRAMIRRRAAANGMFVAYLNTVGGQDELVFDGNSIICGPDGAVIARGPAFQESLLIADLDLDAVPPLDPSGIGADYRTAIDAIGKPKTVTVAVPASSPQPRPPLTPAPDYGEPGETEEIYRALVLGTRDYLYKTGFAKAIVGLSGGIDSALTAVIASDALGPENVLGITMPSRHSSPGSVNDSAQLARNLGLEFWQIPIEPAHAAFDQMLSAPFAGTESNVAEENVQARIRGNILMTIANKFGWIVLTTGNKSEMAMGYATLYGDMAGGFAVLKDIYKTTVYALAQWRNRQNPIIPDNIITKPPSAELRQNQRDTDSLPPYEILDPVIKSYVENDSSYHEMAAQGHPPTTIQQVITAVDRNEYKRRQSPPGVKITPRAFGRDRRLPIVNRYRQP